MAKPWLTSDDLIAAVKRKIALPISQITFTESDILDFANEEMAISQVPSVMSFHEEYFVTEITADLEANKSRYPIPDRAIIEPKAVSIPFKWAEVLVLPSEPT